MRPKMSLEVKEAATRTVFSQLIIYIAINEVSTLLTSIIPWWQN